MAASDQATRTIATQMKDATYVATRMAATRPISRRTRRIAGSRNSRPNMWSEGAPTRLRIPIQALARPGGTTKTASTDSTVRTIATG